MQDAETGKSTVSDIRTSSGMFFGRNEDDIISGRAPALALGALLGAVPLSWAQPHKSGV